MNQIVKACAIHGNLTIDEVQKYRQKKNKTGYTLRCYHCLKEKAWKGGLKCKTHGVLKFEDIKSNGRCKFCHRESVKKSIDKDRDGFNEALREKVRRDKMNRPEEWKERQKRYYQQNLKKEGENRVIKEILRMHKLTGEQYDQMIRDQDNKCAICLNPETRPSRTKGKVTRLSVDHCHTTNKVRGLLCYKCNLILGYATDSIDILYSAIMYLESNQDRE